MYNSKLLEIFRKLNVEEIRKFKKFVASPYFFRHDDVVKLYEYLFSRKYLSENNADRTKIFQYLYKNAAYDDARLRYITSLALDVLEQFFQTERNNQNEVQNLLAISKTLHEKQLPNNADHFLQKAIIIQQKKTTQNAAYWQQQFQLEEEIFRQSNQQSRSKENNLQNILSTLDQYYITQLLKYACIAISYQQIIKQDYQYLLLQTVLDVAKQDENQLNKISLIYYKIYQLYTSSELHYFDDLLQLLPKHSAYFSLDELKDIYLLIINFGIKQLNSGNKSFAKKLYSIYQSGLQNKVFIENEKISRFTFTNIVFTGLQSEDFDGVYSFIKTHEKYLPENFKKSTIGFNKARYYYFLKEYKKSLQYLTDYEYNDVLQNLAVKNMQLKIYVETQEWEILDAFLNTFSVFLHRQKGLGYHQLNYKNTIKYARRLAEVNASSKKIKNALSAEIESENNILDKEWFLDRLK
ncbi:MAG: hypothetical protein U0U67_01350 [Chitinophagales bacterium]